MAVSKMVTFHINAPEASSVAIAGDFNGWNQNARQMRRRKDGVWWVNLRLSPGHHQYKFVIDGTYWQEDPSNPNRTTNEQGTTNSVCEVT